MKNKALNDKGTRWLFGLVVGLVLTLVAIGSLNSYINDVPDIAIPSPEPTPQPNGYDLYIAANGLLTPGNPPIDQVLDRGSELSAQEKVRRYSLGRKEKWYAANQRGFIVLRQALNTKAVVPVLPFPAENTRVGNLGVFIKLAQYKEVECKLFKLRGQWLKAGESALDAIRIGHVLLTGTATEMVWGPSIISGRGRGLLIDIPEHLTAADARDLARKLEKTYITRAHIKQTLANSRAYNLRYLHWLMNEEGWRRMDGFEEEPTWRQKWQWRIRPNRQILDAVARSHDTAIVQSKQAYSEPRSMEREHPDKLIEYFGPPKYLLSNWRISQTTTGLILYRLALRAYFLEHGVYPATLQELSPHYLSRQYLDPFGMSIRPYRYVQSGKGYQLWSVGPDGKDDGGRRIARYKRKNQMSVNYKDIGDIVVTP